MTDKIDTSDEACAVVCMIVSNPGGDFQKPGWKKRVNDLIRALRDERADAKRERDVALAESVGLRRALEPFAKFAGKIPAQWVGEVPLIGRPPLSAFRAAQAALSSLTEHGSYDAAEK